MKPLTTRRVAGGCLLILAASCAGTETGNPNLDAAAQVRVGANLPLPNSNNSSVVPFLAEQAYLGIQSVTALGCQEGSTRVLDSSGVELFPTSSRILELGAVEACGYRVDLAPMDVGPDGAKESASVLILGQSANGQPVTINSAAPQSLTLSVLAPPLVLDEESSYLLFFDLAFWIEDVNLAGLGEGPDGIRIDETSHPELLAPLIAALGTGLTLRQDLDGDGQVDPEDAVVAGPP